MKFNWDGDGLRPRRRRRQQRQRCRPHGWWWWCLCVRFSFQHFKHKKAIDYSTEFISSYIMCGCLSFLRLAFFVASKRIMPKKNIIQNMFYGYLSSAHTRAPSHTKKHTLRRQSMRWASEIAAHTAKLLFIAINWKSSKLKETELKNKKRETRATSRRREMNEVKKNGFLWNCIWHRNY